jgi:nucleotide-binding universal stress UspA family protein
VVLCIDPESDSIPTELVADVAAWASAFRIPIEVFAVVDPVLPVDYDGIFHRNERLEAAAAALSTDDRVAKLVRFPGSRPGRDIARYVDSVDGTLVALSTHTRSLPARVVLGSTAMAVLRHATSPVLVRRFPTR